MLEDRDPIPELLRVQRVRHEMDRRVDRMCNDRCPKCCCEIEPYDSAEMKEQAMTRRSRNHPPPDGCHHQCQCWTACRPGEATRSGAGHEPVAGGFSGLGLCRSLRRRSSAGGWRAGQSHVPEQPTLLLLVPALSRKNGAGPQTDQSLRYRGVPLNEQPSCRKRSYWRILAKSWKLGNLTLASWAKAYPASYSLMAFVLPLYRHFFPQMQGNLKSVSADDRVFLTPDERFSA